MTSPGDSQHDSFSTPDGDDLSRELPVNDALKDVEKFDPQQMNAARKVLGLIHRVRRSRESQPDQANADTGDLPQQTAKLTPRPAPPNPTIESENIVAEPSLKIDRFEIKRQIGKGGYGLVYLAYDRQLNRDVALKVPRPEVVVDPVLRERFRREARAAAALSHPNIVPVFDSGGDGPICYIAYPFIEGITLETWLAGNSDVDARDQTAMARLLATLAEAVEHAHQRGVLHRDLKPSNVLLQADPDDLHRQLDSLVPMITDFGLARIEKDWAAACQTQTGAVIGTPSYMAPEQTRAGTQAVDARTDIYSLGAILYELLTGKPPFHQGGVLEVLQQVQQTDPPHPRKLNASASGDLAAICLKCLEKSPNQRYETAWELQADLLRFSDGRSVAARPSSPLRKLRKWWTRNPAWATSMAVTTAAILLGLATVTALWLRTDYLRRQSDHRGLALSQRKKELESANRRLQSRTDLLNTALRGLFLEVATSPEIKSPEAAPLRQSLLRRANEFYTSLQQDEPLDKQSQQGRGQTLYELARLHEYLGDVKESLSLVRQALQNEPDATPEDRVAWHNYASLRLRQLGRFDEAENEFQNALQIANAGQLDPQHDAHRWLIVRASLLTNQADLRNVENDYPPALELSNQALQIFDRLDQTSEFAHSYDLLFNKAKCLWIRGRILGHMRRFEENQTELESAIDILAELANNDLTDHAEVRLQLAKCWYDQGVSFSRQNNPASARLCYQQALEQMNTLPEELDLALIKFEEYQRIDYSLAVADMLVKDFAAAEQRILDSVQPIRQFIDDQPQTRSLWLDSLGDRYNLLYVIRVRSPEKDYAAAEEAIRSAIGCYEEVLGERPDWAEARLSLVQSQTNLGNLLQRQNQLPGAWTQYRMAEEELDVLSRTKPKWAKLVRCRCNLLQGKMHTAASEKQFDEALQFCLEAQKYLSPKAVNHLLLDQARFLVELENSNAASDCLREFGEQTANQPRDYIAAANRAMEIAERLGDDQRSAEFRVLAIELLNQGARLQNGQLEKFLPQVTAHSRLAELVDQIDPGQ